MNPIIQLSLLIVPYLIFLNAMHEKNKKLVRKSDLVFVLYSALIAIIFCGVYVGFAIFPLGSITDPIPMLLGRIIPLLYLTRSTFAITKSDDDIPTSILVTNVFLPVFAGILAIMDRNIIALICIFDIYITAYRYGFPSLSSAAVLPGGWLE